MYILSFIDLHIQTQIHTYIIGYARTFVAWAREYGEPYSACKPSFIQWQKGHNLISLLVPPIGIYRMYVWSKYGKTPTAILPAEEKIHPQQCGGGDDDDDDDDDCITTRGSVVTLPIMEPGVVPKNQLNQTLNDTSATTKTTSALWFLSTTTDVGACAGACQSSSACAAGSCGTSGCGGTCGGNALLTVVIAVIVVVVVVVEVVVIVIVVVVAVAVVVIIAVVIVVVVVAVEVVV